ncbi:hypothetical protein IPC744_14135 [Pseudomonas aeruginosa]|nr:hypothetical protein AO902_13000 [Pseudomonas aeruginosa]RPW11230.1 hypothetical protein IPC776_01910 [Pseudomonas aeruginosa]RPW66430.1 hypothetical protein IPC744_14135 [Pseudomonas aeruginosa]RQI01319.1 hypothetical protein IPC97_03670 [Pseudomonas aeruginosa]
MPSEWWGESFGCLQKEFAWKGETRGQGNHDARSSAKQQLPPLMPCRQ